MMTPVEGAQLAPYEKLLDILERQNKAYDEYSELEARIQDKEDDIDWIKDDVNTAKSKLDECPILYQKRKEMLSKEEYGGQVPVKPTMGSLRPILLGILGIFALNWLVIAPLLYFLDTTSLLASLLGLVRQISGFVMLYNLYLLFRYFQKKRNYKKALKEYEEKIQVYNNQKSQFEKERPQRIQKLQEAFLAEEKQLQESFEQTVDDLDKEYQALEELTKAYYQKGKEVQEFEEQANVERSQIPSDKVHRFPYGLRFVIEKIKYQQVATIPEAYTLLEKDLRFGAIKEALERESGKVTDALNKAADDIIQIMLGNQKEVRQKLEELRFATVSSAAQISREIASSSAGLRQGQREIAAGLNNVGQKVDNVGQKVDNVGNKVDKVDQTFRDFL